MASFRKFVVTFITFIVVFGIVGIFSTSFMIGIVNDLMDKESQKVSGAQDGPEDGKSGIGQFSHIEGDSYSFLIVANDYDPENHIYEPDDNTLDLVVKSAESSEKSLGILKKYSRRVTATWAVLVKVDKEHGEYLICYLSPETRIYTSAGPLSLGDVYGLFGINVLKEYVTGLTGIKVDYHFILDGYLMNDVVDTFGKSSVDLTSGICSFGEYYMTDYNFTKEELEAEKPEKEPPEDDEKEQKDETLVEEMPVPEYVVYVGTHELSGETLTAVSNLKECGLNDIKLKYDYVTKTVEFYLRRFADMSRDELKNKYKKVTASTPFASDDPLEFKPSLASDFRTDDIDKVWELIKAIKTFNVNRVCYPGNYVSTGDAEIGYYAPSYKNAIEDFKKYR